MKDQQPGEMHLASIELQRYPSTTHLEGSRLQRDDRKAFQPLGGLAGAYAVIEEKLDGGNSGLSFTEGGQLLLQSRGHYLMGGGRERQFAQLHPWAAAHEAWLLERLEDRYVMYGEWLAAKHAMFLDAIPGGLFQEFDLWDRQEQCFLSTKRRSEILAGGPVISVPVLYEGDMPTESKLLQSLVRPSLAKSERWRENFEDAVRKRGLDLEMAWKQTDQSDLAEGLYIKIEDADHVIGRFKFVRHSFTQAILDSESHHAERPIIANQLLAGTDVYAPQVTTTWEDVGLRTIHGLDALKSAIEAESSHCRRRRP